jgi:hypothetical protein
MARAAAAANAAPAARSSVGSPSASAAEDFESFLSNIQNDLQAQYQQQQARLSPPPLDRQKPQQRPFQQQPQPRQQQSGSQRVHLDRHGSAHISPAPAPAPAQSQHRAPQVPLVPAEYDAIVAESDTRREVLSAIEELALHRLQGTCRDARRVLRLFEQKELTLDQGSPHPWRGNSNLVGKASPASPLTSPTAAAGAMSPNGFDIGGGVGGSRLTALPQTAAGAANLCQALQSNLEQEVRHAVAIGVDDEHPTILEARRLAAAIQKLVDSRALLQDTGNGSGAVDHYERQARERRDRVNAEEAERRSKSLSQVDRLKDAVAKGEEERAALQRELDELRPVVQEREEAAERAAEELASLQVSAARLWVPYACVRACVRACVCVRACARACADVPVSGGARTQAPTHPLLPRLPSSFHCAHHPAIYLIPGPFSWKSCPQPCHTPTHPP